MNTKRSVSVIVVAILLLVSLVSMASAASQTWYLIKVESGVPSPATYQMHKDSGNGATPHPEIATGNSLIWAADQSVAADSIDMAATWRVEVHSFVDDADADKPTKMEVHIGRIRGGSFTSIGTAVNTNSGGSYNRVWGADIAISDFPLTSGDYLACEIENTGTASTYANVFIDTTGDPDSPTYITYPYDDPDYPVPELSTLLLTSLGVLMLGGFVVYSRRRNTK